MRIYWCAVVLTFLGAGCERKPTASLTEPRPQYKYTSRTSARTLWEDLRVGDLKWVNRTVIVDLPARSYTVRPDEILWHHSSSSAPPSLIMRCPDPPADNSAPIRVRGRVVGPIRDNRVRPGGADWYILMEHCLIGR